MDKICVVFCEGQHDIAFTSRVLKAHGFNGYDKKIKDFIQPFNNLFEGLLSEKKVSDKKLGFSSDYRIPNVALSKDNTLVLFHSMGGDGRERERKELLDLYKTVKGEDDFTSEYRFNYRFVYLFDADNIGIERRVQDINLELGFEEIIQNGKVISNKGHEWGCYIFHNTELKGDLEDLLLDLIGSRERVIVDASSNFINENCLPQDRTCEYICTPTNQNHKTTSKFKIKKSKISIAGQLQFSGMSNAVFISNTDYLAYDDLTNNVHCVAISGLFD